MARVVIGGRAVGEGEAVFVIAEAGVNHNGDEAVAHRLVDAAADARADAVKFQTFDPNELVVASADKAEYQKRTSGAGTQRQMLDRLALSVDAQRRVADHTRDRGLLFLSTPFDEPSVAVVVSLGVPAIKVSSGDLTALPLLRRIGREQLPVLLSTGMGDLDEIRDAVNALREGGSREIVLLHCVSSYPAPPEDANLRAMATLRETFSLPVGFSDHTVGTTVTVAAVALGACVVEKHFTLDRSLPGPDHAASIEPDDLARLVADVRSIERALGDGKKGARPSERDALANLRKSIVALRDLSAGTELREMDLGLKRPGGGLPAKAIPDLVGRRLARDVRADEMIRRADVK